MVEQGEDSPAPLTEATLAAAGSARSRRRRAAYTLRPGVEIRPASVGGSLVTWRPLRALEVNPPLLRLVQRLDRGWVEPDDPAEEAVFDRLCQAGLLERRAPLLDREDLPPVSVVIPVKDRAAELERCLGSLKALDYPEQQLEIIVVDDGSSDETAAVGERLGARVVTSGGVGLGPADARNRGAAVATGEVLAFIDSDCLASPAWLLELAGEFVLPGVAAVGGFVAGSGGGRTLDRYEEVMSSLNLGRRELRGGPGNDTFYLPSCNLLVRGSAFQTVGGFRAGMRVGEDVDLSWRLRAAGGMLVYLPRGVVRHEHRSRLAPFLRRRFQYGTSEGPLQLLHPSRRKRMALPLVPAAAVLLAAGALALGPAVVLPWPLLPAAGALLLCADCLGAARRWHRRGLPLGLGAPLLARLRVAGSLAYYLAYHAVRYYGWLLLGLTALRPSAGLLAAVLLLLPALVDYRVRRPELDPVRFCLCYLAEHLAYGAGVFYGCLRVRSFRSYRPVRLSPRGRRKPLSGLQAEGL